MSKTYEMAITKEIDEDDIAPAAALSVMCARRLVNELFYNLMSYTSLRYLSFSPQIVTSKAKRLQFG